MSATVRPCAPQIPAGLYLHLLNLLDLKPGDHVLEVGSGTGWLAALMANLVGKEGSVTGLELDASLVQEAITNIAALGFSNTEIHVGDIRAPQTFAHAFDKIIFTASAFSIPEGVFNALKTDGLLGLPIRNRGLGEEFYVLQKADSDRARSIATRVCQFVPIVEDAGMDTSGVRRLDGAARACASQPPQRDVDFPLIRDQGYEPKFATRGLQRFLSKWRPDFTVWDLDLAAPSRALHALTPEPKQIAFGFFDAASHELTFWTNERLKSFGASGLPKSEVALTQGIGDWIEHGRPYGQEFTSKSKKLILADRWAH